MNILKPAPLLELETFESLFLCFFAGSSGSNLHDSVCALVSSNTKSDANHLSNIGSFDK